MNKFNWKGSKFRNVITEVDGIKFASKLEAKRWVDLQRLEKVGAITDLKRQVKFQLNEGGTFSYAYFADFTYIENGNLIVEDAKGTLTAVFKKKRKLMKQIYNIDILLTTSHKKQKNGQ